MSKDYYKVLGVAKGASQDEIKKAYRKKAHEYHPDKAGGDEAKFKEINEAYQVLGDQQKRTKYDQYGAGFEQAGGGFGGFNGFGGFSNGAGGIHVDMEDLGDLFGGIGDIFGFGGSRTSSQRRASDIRVSLEIDFLEAVFGVEKKINLNKKVVCDRCHGNLAEPGTKIEDCAVCKGTGRVSKIQRTILGNMQVQGICDNCQGEGKTYAKKCIKCAGEGVINGDDNFKIKIPAGIDDGEVIRLNGKGEAGTRGGKSGDLYVIVRVRPDQRWKRQGSDIETKQEISFTQAALGDKIKIETVEGAMNLKIPAGTQSGTVFKIRNKGITRLRGGGKGDHYVKVSVKIPTGLNRKQRKALEEIGL